MACHTSNITVLNVAHLFQILRVLSLARWWQLKYFVFSPRKLGKIFQFDGHIFRWVQTTNQLVIPEFVSHCSFEKSRNQPLPPKSQKHVSGGLITFHCPKNDRRFPLRNLSENIEITFGRPLPRPYPIKALKKVGFQQTLAPQHVPTPILLLKHNMQYDSMTCLFFKYHVCLEKNIRFRDFLSNKSVCSRNETELYGDCNKL